MVYVQNRILFVPELGISFDPRIPWLSMDPHCTTDEDGRKISEWPTPIGPMREFFRLS
jgi:hypothetical protein